MADPPGFEPRQRDSKSLVLPLHQGSKSARANLACYRVYPRLYRKRIPIQVVIATTHISARLAPALSRHLSL